MKAVIFDFDGTLTDIHKNWDESVQLINQALTKHKLRTFTSNELLELRRKQTKEMIQALNIPFYKAPFLIPKLFSELRHIFPHPIAYQPMIDELVTIRSLVNIVGILTSNTYESVSHFLDKHNLTPTFDFVVSNKNVFGKHQSLTKLLKEYSYQTTDLWYVGDEVRDVDACRKTNINCIAVSWGIGSKDALVDAGATNVVDRPKEITDIVKQHQS